MKLTVAELILELGHYPPDAPISAWSGCHDCGGPDVHVEFDDEHGVSITGHDFRGSGDF